MKKDMKIPFDKDGNMLSYPEVQYFYYSVDTNEELPWDECKLLSSDKYTRVGKLITKDNMEFYDTLEYMDYDKGRSSVVFTFKSALTNTRYSMFISEFNRIILLKRFNENKVTGMFTFAKQGSNFSIKLRT